MNSDIERLNTLFQRINNSTDCNNGKCLDDEIRILREKWNDSNYTLENINDIHNNNEKNYFIAKYGEDYYNNFKLEYYTKIVNNWSTNQINYINDINDWFTLIIQNLKDLFISKLRLEQLHNSILKENINYEKNIDEYYNNQFTDRRRVYYEIEDNDSIKSTRFYIKLLYYSFIVGYIIFGGFLRNNGYKNWKLWLAIIIYCLFPFILSYLIFYIVYYYQYYSGKAPY